MTSPASGRHLRAIQRMCYIVLYCVVYVYRQCIVSIQRRENYNTQVLSLMQGMRSLHVHRALCIPSKHEAFTLC